MKTYSRLLCLLISSSLSTYSIAGDAFDVDDADSLDFESFHTSKDNAIKLYDSKTGQILPGQKDQVQKTYEEPAAAKKETVSADTEKANNQAASPGTPAITPASTVGQRFEIRQRYAIGDSEHTTDTPYTAMNALHKKMAKHCPNGWVKQKEWAVPIDSDFYLHYEFQCTE